MEALFVGAHMSATLTSPSSCEEACPSPGIRESGLKLRLLLLGVVDGSTIGPVDEDLLDHGAVLAFPAAAQHGARDSGDGSQHWHQWFNGSTWKQGASKLRYVENGMHRSLFWQLQLVRHIIDFGDDVVEAVVA